MPEHKALVDETTYALLARVAEAANALEVACMVTGAAGRLLLLERVYGLPSGRATEDVDFGVMVESWAQYQALVQRICQDLRFRQDPKQRQRLRFSEGSYLDLVPFGGVESTGHMIQWPPDGEFTMSVAGFREAYADSMRVLVNDELVVPVVSPVGLVLLKLVAWEERHPAYPRKDAADIAYVLQHFGTLLTEEVLFDEYFDAVMEAEYDIDLAAARVLGRRLSEVVADDTRDWLSRLLTRELRASTDSALVREVAESLTPIGAERACDLLAQLRLGVIKKGPS